MAFPRKTRSKVTPNAKWTSLNVRTLPYDSSFVAADGQPIMYGTGGSAARVVGGNTDVATIFINFVESSRSDIATSQGDPFVGELPDTAIATGGLAGIEGNGLDIGLAPSCWATGVLPAIGEGVFVEAASGLFTTEALAAGSFYYGVINRLDQNQAFFKFDSLPRQLA